MIPLCAHSFMTTTAHRVARRFKAATTPATPNKVSLPTATPVTNADIKGLLQPTLGALHNLVLWPSVADPMEAAN